MIGYLPNEFCLERRGFQRLSGQEFLVAGSFPIYELRNLAGLEWKDEDVATVGGYIVRQIGHLPRVGERLRMHDCIVTIEQANGRRVQQVRIRRVA